ncbi:MAG: hypothetical protein J6M02_06220 [Clostridia bacterium]|nr:hypothetical protein [Clostridia bacterium]
MALIQCMIVAAFPLAICLGIKVGVLYFRYRFSVKELLILQHLFQIESCTVEGKKINLTIKNSVLPDNLRRAFYLCFNGLLQTKIVTVAKENNTGRFIPCFQRKGFEDLLVTSLFNADRIQKKYKEQGTYVQVLLEDYYTYLKQLYDDLEQKYLNIKSLSEEVEIITIRPKS